MTDAPMRDIVQRGLWFEEFEEGVRYLHRPGRTVTDADNVLFTTLTMNPQPLHLDAAWSAGQLTQGTLVANLGFGEVAFPNPVFVGDTLYGESVVTSKRLSASRPGQGVLVLAHTARNQDGVVVATASRTMLVWTREAGERPAGPRPAGEDTEEASG